MDEIKKKMAAALARAKAIADASAGRGETDLTGEDLANVTEALKEYEALKKQLAEQQSSDQVKSALAAIGLELGLEQAPEEKAIPAAFGGRPRGKSVGQLFTESDEYQSFVKSFADGRIPEKARVQSQPMGVKSLITGADDASAGAFVQTDYTGIFETLGRRPLTVRDLISVRQTGSDTVEYVRQVSRVNAAAVVPEATTAAGATVTTEFDDPDYVSTVELPAGSGVKPEGGFAFLKVTATVKTIAEWIPATKRGLADVGQLRGLIDQELRDGLAEEEEDQILNGNGSGENFTGILNTSGIQTQTFSTDIVQTIRKAKTKARTVGRVIPNGVMLNPVDWEKIELLQDGNDRYYGGGPFGATTPSVWGLPVVESEAIAEGTALVGDWRKAVIWDREQASISVTDSHADFFIRNLVAVLGEERLAFGVTRPSAFVKATVAA